MSAERRLRFKGTQPEPLGVPATAERMALALAVATKKGELTEMESKITLAVASLFIDEIETLDKAAIDLRAQNQELSARLLEIRRMAKISG